MIRQRRSILSALIFVPFASVAWHAWGFTGAWSSYRGGAGTGKPLTARANQADPYTVLGLPPGTVDEDAVRTAFRRLAKVYHPDEIQTAAQQLITGRAPGAAWDASSLENLFTGSSTHIYSSAAQRPPSTAHQPLQQADFASTRNGRVDADIAYCASMRDASLRKTARLDRITLQASAETLSRVQRVLTEMSGTKAEPSMPLPMVGFILEGHTHSIGEQQVANIAMALEKDFGIELLTILAGTWINFPMPVELQTVKDLADFIESKLAA
eukprot:s518_g11.t1